MEEINKINEFCRYENFSVDYYLSELDFKKYFDFILKNNISKVLLTDANVLDSDLTSFTEKIISLHKNNVSVLCASYDFPDPFQLAIRTLNMGGKDNEEVVATESKEVTLLKEIRDGINNLQTK